jgi:hypothetical protein
VINAVEKKAIIADSAEKTTKSVAPRVGYAAMIRSAIPTSRRNRSWTGSDAARAASPTTSKPSPSARFQTAEERGGSPGSGACCDIG